nr:hypothetical protein Iba_chr09bCG10270 [Ipomoea batatas]
MRSGSHGITILATWGKTSFQCDLTKLAIRSPSRVTRILGCGLNGSGAYKFLEVDLASHEIGFSKHNESFTMSSDKTSPSMCARKKVGFDQVEVSYEQSLVSMVKLMPPVLNSASGRMRSGWLPMRSLAWHLGGDVY